MGVLISQSKASGCPDKSKRAWKAYFNFMSDNPYPDYKSLKFVKNNCQAELENLGLRKCSQRILNYAQSKLGLQDSNFIYSSSLNNTDYYNRLSVEQKVLPQIFQKGSEEDIKSWAKKEGFQVAQFFSLNRYKYPYTREDKLIVKVETESFNKWYLMNFDHKKVESVHALLLKKNELSPPDFIFYTRRSGLIKPYLQSQDNHEVPITSCRECHKGRPLEFVPALGTIDLEDYAAIKKMNHEFSLEKLGRTEEVMPSPIIKKGNCQECHDNKIQGHVSSDIHPGLLKKKLIMDYGKGHSLNIPEKIIRESFKIAEDSREKLKGDLQTIPDKLLLEFSIKTMGQYNLLDKKTEREMLYSVSHEENFSRCQKQNYCAFSYKRKNQIIFEEILKSKSKNSQGWLMEHCN
jgi:hypothetical protein